MLAELDWRIETEYKEENSLLAVDDPPIYLKPRVDKQQQSTPQCPLVGDSEPKETGPLPTPKSRSLFSSVTVPTHIPPKNGRTYDAEHHATDKVTDSRTRIMGHQSPLPTHPQNNVRSVRSERDGNGEQTPKDHIAAMWKIQLLNGVTPTQFSGHPADFPFFRDEVRTHLESELLTDAQRVMYLPKFLTGEALEVVNRNRGCSYEELLKTLEERFGQAVQVTQACIEELVDGPKFESGDSVSLLNFLEKLNTATKILKGEFEHEANVATNLKRIVNRLPHDLIIKWQSMNYNIVGLGRTAKLQDITSFVKKQALMKNDPVFGTQPQRKDYKESKDSYKLGKEQSQRLSPKTTTISATSVENIAEERPSNLCPICKNDSHRLPTVSDYQTV